MNWTIELVPAGNWKRGNEPNREATEARVHVIPVSFEATRFTQADAQPYPLDYLTFTGWNPSWVKVNGVWMRAYRPNEVDESKARQMAEKMVDILDVTMPKVLGRFSAIEYIGLDILFDS